MNEEQTKQPVVGWAEIYARIQNYLGNGGLFNPELMEHEKVRDLLIDVRDMLHGGGGCGGLADAPIARKTAFDSSAWLALLARWLEVERELREEETKALARGDTKDADQWRAQWCGLKPRVNDLAEEIGRASKANEPSSATTGAPSAPGKEQA